jgi:hypothetical protein
LGISDPEWSVGVFCGPQRAHEGALGSETHLDVVAATELKPGQVVPGHHVGGYVTAGREHGAEVGRRVSQQIEQGQRVVDTCVAIEDQGHGCHASTLMDRFDLLKNVRELPHVLVSVLI